METDLNPSQEAEVKKVGAPRSLPPPFYPRRKVFPLEREWEWVVGSELTEKEGLQGWAEEEGVPGPSWGRRVSAGGPGRLQA